MEDQPAVVAKKGSALIPSIVTIAAAVLLCASYFLPFTSVKDESAATSIFAQAYEINEGSDLTVSDLANPSIVTWARFYKAYCDRLERPVTSSLNDCSIMFWVIVVSGVAAVLALLFALLRKATPTSLLALANLGLISFVGWYFEKYGPVPSGAASNWAFGRLVMLGSAAVLTAAGVWLFVAKRAEKKAAAA
ncbi:hypothetical protein [Paratractidigestivibacter sp.]|uniref:hypothetical protein n=1 Tax=Paratractidigestivibacter sp. TaxID=2847316 RepID=UPI002ABD9A77|nr:hypothetical protein [Paratractidigestivibacter sp.]